MIKGAYTCATPCAPVCSGEVCRKAQLPLPAVSSKVMQQPLQQPPEALVHAGAPVGCRLVPNVTSCQMNCTAAAAAARQSCGTCLFCLCFSCFCCVAAAVMCILICSSCRLLLPPLVIVVLLTWRVHGLVASHLCCCCSAAPVLRLPAVGCEPALQPALHSPAFACCCRICCCCCCC